MQPTDPPPLSAATDEPQTPQAPNAPQAPQAPQPPSKADLFYRVDSSRASFRELWRDARSPAVLVAWLSKLFRVKLPGSVNDPNVTSLRPFEVDETQLPSNVRERFEWVVEELRRLGFTPVAYHAVDDHLHTSRLFIANLAHADGLAVARIHLRMEGSSQPPKTHFFWDFLSGVRDGTFVWSSSARALLEPPPECRQIWRHRAGPAPLWDAHREALRRLPGGEGSIVPARSKEEILDLVERHHAAVSAFHLRRGLFAPLTADERARAAGLESAVASASAAAAPGADPVSADDAKVMYELQQLQAKKSNWVTGGLILLVSLLLFVGAGSWQFSWDFVAMIVVILFFHELGHYVAMRVFRYRNVRMFFIPFFGAAVTGQNFSAPGWKKVVVSLMGPLPGILVGVVLGGVGLLVGNALLLKVAVMTLILNAFNLLPVLPLDGGWVMHALLFSRHHLLDAVFRVGAAAALLLGGYALGDTLLTVLGVVMAMGIPSAYKLARATTELRRAGAVPPAAPGEQTVPADAARTIIAKLRAAFPKGMPAKVLASHVLDVYQTLNARPPGVGASIGF